MENKILKLRRKKEKAYTECNYDLVYGYCVDLAQIFLDNEDFSNALKEFMEAEQAGEMANKNIYVAKAKRMIGEVFVLMEKPKEAIKHVLKYLELSKREGDLKEEQRALATLARTYFVLAESLIPSREREIALEEAEDYNMKSLFICDRLKEVTNNKDVGIMKARVYLNLGLVMEAQDRSDKAVEYLEKAVNISRNLDLWEELCLSYTNLGIAYKHRDDTANALKAFDLGLGVASRLSEKVKSMCSILSLKAEVLFGLPDYRGAKRALHKAYKLRTPDDNEHSEIARKLKIVAAVCKLEERLVYMDEENLAEKRRIYESMGDGCAEMESYKKALEYYHLTLKCAEKLGEHGKKLADIYVSLAQTYKDLKDFDKALDFYHLEYTIWKDNPAEACRTCLSLAEILEAKGAPTDEVIVTYKSAQCHAKDAKDLKLQRSVLKTLVRYLKDVQNHTTLASVENELADIEAQLGVDINEESDSESDSNETAAATCGIGDDICLDILTDSELDEDEQSHGKPRTSRRSQKPFHFRRNEKGETPLHTACINGNLALVQRLLDQGHQVDVRDNNGWLPLHEAANFGFVDIVRELLDRGAAVNDRGGPRCGGITPLLDAASCGHLHVMQLLLDQGASPTMRSNKGETVLDCLKEWRRRYKLEEKRDLDDETLRDYNVMEHKIKTIMEKAGHNIPNKSSSQTQQTRTVSDHEVSLNDNRSFQRDYAEHSRDAAKKKVVSGLRRSLDDESVDQSSSSNYGSSSSSNNYYHKRCSDEAVTEYENAIRGLKHRVARAEVPVSPLKESHDALLQPDSVGDDWLVDDLGDSRSSRPTKRRRKGDEFLGQQLRNCNETSSSNPTSRLNRLTVSSSSCSESENDESFQIYPRIEVEFSESTDCYGPNRFEEMSETKSDDSQDQLPSNSISFHHQSVKNSSQKLRKHQTTLLSAGISRQKVQSMKHQEQELNDLPATLPTPSVASGSIASIASTSLGNRQLTVKVLVEDRLLLIVLPNDPQLTISWLADEAARRYKSMEGVEPQLTLQTVEGALLFLQDPLSLIFDLGSEIHAKVTSWNLTPITQRYKDACLGANTAVNIQVESQLDACQATSCLDLENFGLTSGELNPVFKTLYHHHALQHIRLSGNVLGDSGLKALVDAVVRVPQLRELDISCNNISSDGFSYMCQHISQNRRFQSLEVLDMSFNPLGDDCLRSLSLLLSGIPALHTLRMSSVSLISFKASFDLSLETIEVLDISYNKMGQEGARGFLRGLNPDRVCSLNLAAVGKSVAREVGIFLGQCVPHSLVDLNLSYCDVEDCDMVPLIECLQSCPQLQKLNMAGNDQISVMITQKLMQLPLTDLNLAGVNSYVSLTSSISNLSISSNSNSNLNYSAPFSFSTNNVKSLLIVS